MKRLYLIAALILIAGPGLALAQPAWVGSCFATDATNPTQCAINNSGSNLVTVMVSFTSVGGGGTPEALSAAPTYAGASGTQITTGGCSGSPVYTATGTFGANIQTYRKIAPSTGSNDASFNYTANSTYHSPGAATFSGVDQTTPIRDCQFAVVNDASGSTSPSVTCPNAVNGDAMAIWLIELASTGSFVTPGSLGSMTLRTTGGSQTGLKGFFYTDTATGSYTANPSLSSARDYLMVCMALAPVSAPTINITALGGRRR